MKDTIKFLEARKRELTDRACSLTYKASSLKDEARKAEQECEDITETLELIRSVTK